MEEEEVNSKSCIVEPQPFLAAYESEVISEFKQEVGQVLD